MRLPPETIGVLNLQAQYGKPHWDTYFMAIADLVASRATCRRGQIGCVLTKDNRILATGYNGPLIGHSDCVESEGMITDSCCRKGPDGGCIETAHAEQNAVAYAARYGVSLTGCTAYLSGYSPCINCTKLLVQCGCIRVIYNKEYRDTMPLDFLREAGVAYELYTGPILIYTFANS